MATIRFSEQLKSTIRSNANRVFSKKSDTIMAERKPEWTTRVVDEYRRVTNKLMEGVPKEFVSTYEQADLSGFVIDGEQQRIHLDSERVAPMLRPLETLPAGHPVCVEAGIVSVSSNYRGLGFIIADTDPRWSGIISEITAHQAKVKRLEEKSTEFMKGVNAILDGYTTLAPALKAWPPLWDLLPEDTQERHKEPNKRKSQAQRTEELGVDLDKMTAAVATMKLTD
jgi:hypothetical protein